MKAERILTYADAVHEGTVQAMRREPRMIVIGEGVPDPKGIFGTTSGLREEFGADRVFDMPLGENGMTGVCIGAALSGMRPLMIHQRIDFALLAMDQLVNNAAKWHYLFEGCSIPLVVRMIVGRGWGQGPQHSQSLQALFSHIPGLKVVMPASPADAKGMLIGAVADDNPVMFIEHRWLHHVTGHVPAPDEPKPLAGARVMCEGNDVTIAAFSHMVIEALRAAEALGQAGLSVEVLDMRSLSPLDTGTVLASLRKTGRLIVADTGVLQGGVAGELLSQVTEQGFDLLRTAPMRVASPFHPVPTAPSQAEHYYPGAAALVKRAMACIGREHTEGGHNLIATLETEDRRDIPNRDFVGPF